MTSLRSPPVDVTSERSPSRGVTFSTRLNGPEPPSDRESARGEDVDSVELSVGAAVHGVDSEAARPLHGVEESDFVTLGGLNLKKLHFSIHSNLITLSGESLFNSIAYLISSRSSVLYIDEIKILKNIYLIDPSDDKT